MNKNGINVVGIIGNPIDRSLSPAMHNAAFRAQNLDWVYIPFLTEKERLETTIEVLKTLGLRGFNVTMPFKKDIIAYLDKVGDEAGAIMSVNTVINDEGRLSGFSTDGEGFTQAVEAEGEAVEGKRFALIGAGGASRAIALRLAKKKALSLEVINRTQSKAEMLKDIIESRKRGAKVTAVPLDRKAVKAVKNADIVVNTTPLGKETLEGIDFLVDGLVPGQLVCDLTTVPPLSHFLVTARQHGCRVMGGLGMLVYQGALSYKMWTGLDAPIDVMMKAVGADRAATEVVRNA